MNEKDASEVLKVLVAADKLLLQEPIDYLQKYLIENHSDWLKQNFESIHKTSIESHNLLELRQFCTDLTAEKVIKLNDFTFPENSLVSLIKRDDLQIKEVEVWEYVLKWGLAKNPTLFPDPTNWTDNDFKKMKNTLQQCLPLIRFFSLSSKEFSQKVRPYRKLLSDQLYEELSGSYMDPDVKPADNILFPRNIKVDGIIDSKIVNLNVVSIISRWIDRIDVNYKFSYLRELHLPYKFHLLLRGSRDGFTS